MNSDSIEAFTLSYRSIVQNMTQDQRKYFNSDLNLILLEDILRDPNPERSIAFMNEDLVDSILLENHISRVDAFTLGDIRYHAEEAKRRYKNLYRQRKDTLLRQNSELDSLEIIDHSYRPASNDSDAFLSVVVLNKYIDELDELKFNLEISNDFTVFVQADIELSLEESLKMNERRQLDINLTKEPDLRASNLRLDGRSEVMITAFRSVQRGYIRRSELQMLDLSSLLEALTYDSDLMIEALRLK